MADISIFRYTRIKDAFDASGNTLQQQKVSFTFGKRSNTVSGILKLVQNLVKMMLTTPGTDNFDASVGTIINGLFKRGVTASSAQLLKMDIMISIQDLERQIHDIQAGLPIPDDERLKEIQIQTVNFDAASGVWQIQIAVLSEAGEGVAFDIAPFLSGK